MLALGTVLETRIAVGGEVFLPTVRTAAVDAALVHVEALVLRPPALGTEVPLAGEEGGVSRLLQHLGEGHFLQRETVGVGRGKQLRVALPLVRRERSSDVVSDAGALRPLPGDEGRPRRRADRTGRVGVREAHALRGEAIEVGCLVKGAAVAAEIALPEVVGDEEDDAGTVGRGERRDSEKEKEEGKVAGFHEKHSSQIICENPRSSVGICVERSSFTSSRFAIIRGYLRHLR